MIQKGGKFAARCAILELNETCQASERDRVSSEMVHARSPPKSSTNIILPPHTIQHNNVHIWVRGPAKPPCRLFNMYADMYKHQVLYKKRKAEQKHQSRTR